MLSHDLVSESKSFASKFFDESCFKVLIGLLREGQLLSIQEWPANQFGGGDVRNWGILDMSAIAVGEPDEDIYIGAAATGGRAGEDYEVVL